MPMTHNLHSIDGFLLDQDYGPWLEQTRCWPSLSKKKCVPIAEMHPDHAKAALHKLGELASTQWPLAAALLIQAYPMRFIGSTQRSSEITAGEVWKWIHAFKTGLETEEEVNLAAFIAAQLNEAH